MTPHQQALAVREKQREASRLTSQLLATLRAMPPRVDGQRAEAEYQALRVQKALDWAADEAEALVDEAEALLRPDVEEVAHAG